MKRVVIATFALALFSACNVNYEKTKSGVVYKIFSKGNGEKIKANEYVKLYIEYAIPEKDTVFPTSNFGKMPGYSPVDTSSRNQHTHMEVLTKCRVGDSAVFILSVDTLVKRGLIPEYNKLFGRGDKITCKMKILKVFKNEQEIDEDYQKEMALEKDREVNQLEKYLASKNIKAQKTKNGAFVEIQNAGDPTAKVETGKQVSVMYRGYLQSNNYVFDTNMDTTKGHTQPYELVVGKGGVIPGWEEGLPYFAKGAKGRIYIPAMLGYGMQGDQRGGIPGLANLIFDIEIKDVKTPAPQPAAPMGAVPPGAQPVEPGK